MANPIPRTPEQIIDALAQRRGVVTPVPSYFPLGPAFAASCVREAYRDAIDVLAEVADRPGQNAEAAEAFRAAIQTFEARLQDG